MQLSAERMHALLEATSGELADGDPLQAPIEPSQEIWASGVTYQKSREARKAESGDDLYDKVYDAHRPELFLKAVGWRAVGHEEPVRVRYDSTWNVPEPELVLVLNSSLQIVGYAAGNDVSSRDIEGENALYLPQAKVYDDSCAIGPGIQLIEEASSLRDLEIRLRIYRSDAVIFEDRISTSRMHRSLEDLVGYLGRELDFPSGAFLMTGTGIVPEDFTLEPGDYTEISVGSLKLGNSVVQRSPVQSR